MNILIATAEQEILRTQACALVASTPHGELKVYAGHAPLLAILRPCVVRIACLPDCLCPKVKHEHIIVLGGFLEVQADAVTLLADAVERSATLDISHAQQAVQHAREGFRAASSKNIDQALITLEIALARLYMVKHSKT